MLLSLVTLIFFLFSIANADDFYELQYPLAISTAIGQEPLKIQMDFGHSFLVNITSFNGTEIDQPPFCQLNFARYRYDLQLAASGVPVFGAKDNYSIVSYNGYLYVLNSAGFTVQVFGRSASNIFVHYSLTDQLQQEVGADGSVDGGRVFIAINSYSGFLYLFNNKNAFSVETISPSLFQSGSTQNSKIQTRAKVPFNYEDITSVKYYQQRIYILADNIVDVYETEGENIIHLMQLNAEFFGVNEISIKGLGFRGNYAFVLDEFKGLFALNISSDKPNQTVDSSSVFQHLPDLSVNYQGGKFVEITGNTILIASDTLSKIYECYIQENPNATQIVFNREISFPDQDSKTQITGITADPEFLYIATNNSGLIVTKHSIPVRYVDNGYQEQGFSVPSGMNAVFAIGDMNQPLIVDGNTLKRLSTRAPSVTMNCTVVDAIGCRYAYQVEGLSKDCHSKQISSLAGDLNTVCILNRTVSITVDNPANKCSLLTQPDTTTPTTNPNDIPSEPEPEPGSESGPWSEQNNTPSENPDPEQENTSGTNTTPSDNTSPAQNTETTKTGGNDDESSNRHPGEATSSMSNHDEGMIGSPTQKMISTLTEQNNMLIIILAVLTVILIGALSLWLCTWYKFKQYRRINDQELDDVRKFQKSAREKNYATLNDDSKMQSGDSSNVQLDISHSC